MTDVLYAAPPRSGKSIEELADTVRRVFGLIDEPMFPVLSFLEFGLGKIVEDMLFDVMPQAELGAREGAVDPLGRALYLREDVYLAAERGNGRARFTIAHEIGHAIMHVGTLNRVAPSWSMPVYQDPEWQANRFAAALLMPRHLVSKRRFAADVAAEFGVSMEAASVRLKNIGTRGSHNE